MSTHTTTAVWSPDQDVAYTTPARVRALLAAVSEQRTQTTDGPSVAALDVAAALLYGQLLDVTPRQTPLPVPGVLLALLQAQGGVVGALAEAALDAAGW